ncbi:MAG: S8 family serine peptidase [Clostridiales bacterium]|nr:S8 family serine peptidase [Clostridiales bacterium]
MRKMAIIFFMITMLCPSFRVLADSGGYIVKFKNEYIPESINNSLIDSGLGDNVYLTDNIDALKGYDTLIEYIETNDTVNLIDGATDGIQCFSIDETIGDAWQLDMVNAQYAWDLATYGNDINVGVIDSGCNRHIDIINNLVGGHNYILNTDDYSDNVGHGTHVSGIIAAEKNDFGITGIAPKANIYALKCFDANYQTTVSMLAKAIYSAIDDYHCRIINMSLGLKANRQTLYDAVKYAVDNNVIIVAAVGNDGDDTQYYPAAYEEVIGVGSVGANKEKSYFSQFNESVFVVAPGECYYSLKGTDEYIKAQGTSQATPLVAGSAAVLLSADYSLSNTELKELLMCYSGDLGEEGFDTEYGYGLLNTEALLKSVIGQYYISPINNGEVIIYNNTADDLFATGIWSEETVKGGFCGKINEIFVPPQQKISLEYSGEKFKFFLWDSFNTMRPLTTMRKGEMQK